MWIINHFHNSNMASDNKMEDWTLYSDDEEPPMKETEIEEPPTPDPMRRVKKQQEYVACPQCQKSMLLKTFKYYHSYKCRPEAPQPTIAKQVASERIEVSFNESQSQKDQRNDNQKIDI